MNTAKLIGIKINTEQFFLKEEIKSEYFAFVSWFLGGVMPKKLISSLSRGLRCFLCNEFGKRYLVFSHKCFREARLLKYLRESPFSLLSLGVGVIFERESQEGGKPPARGAELITVHEMLQNFDLVPSKNDLRMYEIVEGDFTVFSPLAACLNPTRYGFSLKLSAFQTALGIAIKKAKSLSNNELSVIINDCLLILLGIILDRFFYGVMEKGMGSLEAAYTPWIGGLKEVIIRNLECFVKGIFSNYVRNEFLKRVKAHGNGIKTVLEKFLDPLLDFLPKGQKDSLNRVLLGRINGLIRALEEIELSSEEVVIPIVPTEQFSYLDILCLEDFARRNNMKIRLVPFATNLSLMTFLAITKLNELLRAREEEEIIRIESPLLITDDVYYSFLVITGKLHKYLSKGEKVVILPISGFVGGGSQKTALIAAFRVLRQKHGGIVEIKI